MLVKPTAMLISEADEIDKPQPGARISGVRLLWLSAKEELMVVSRRKH